MMLYIKAIGLLDNGFDVLEHRREASSIEISRKYKLKHKGQNCSFPWPQSPLRLRLFFGVAGISDVSTNF